MPSPQRKRIKYKQVIDAGVSPLQGSSTFSPPINYFVVLMRLPLLKKGIVLEVEKKHLPLHVSSLKFGAAPQTICRWLKVYRE